LTEARLAELTEIQGNILNSCAELVKEGGNLSYVTCSVFDAENADQISNFISKNPTWQVTYSKKWMPSEKGDGFFLCNLNRIPTV